RHAGNGRVGELQRRARVAAGARGQGHRPGRRRMHRDAGRLDRAQSADLERGYRGRLTGRPRARRAIPLGTTPIRACLRAGQRASIVNAPKATPRSQPSPVPASASETSPLVIAWALLDLTAPAWASAAA